MNTKPPPPKRVAPHTVAPTTRLLRDSMLHGHQDLYGAIDDEELDDVHNSHLSIHNYEAENSKQHATTRVPFLHRQWSKVECAASQLPAIALVTLFHLMVGIPFGVSYFPVGWRSSSAAAAAIATDDDNISVSEGGFVLDGPFPIAAKEALGIRMFLLSTIIGQLSMTYASNFKNCIALQMVENVPFCQSLAYIVVQHQGYGMEALSTLFFLFGLASLIVGAVFYILGRFEMGKVLYFFPAHVLVGCIGGIGVFIAKTGLEITANASFGVVFIQRIHLLLVVFGFEVGLRVLNHLTKDSSGTSRYPLLSPIYFCLITPIFYLSLWVLGKSTDSAVVDGYFFPPLNDCSEAAGCGGINSFLSPLWTESTWEVFRMINFSTISWAAVWESIPTMVALVLFSLIHVPINIPAFAVSTDVDVDMNKELVAHGWSNGIAGLFGALQCYLAYTQSIIYYKSGGNGRASSLAVASLTSVLFFVGPSIASHIPRCMAGTLLLHCGIDLFLEGVSDSYGKYDYLEYAGIWAITVVMTVFGMESALLTGGATALLTYAVQSVTYLSPIRGSMTAATLRSSEWNRSPAAYDILDADATGRLNIRVIQLQGHLFFANISSLADSLKQIVRSNRPYVVIIDFTLVLGIDSSAAQAIIKLRDKLTHQLGTSLVIFVPGSTSGFPCESNLSEQLTTARNFSGSHVCDDLDTALIYAEVSNQVCQKYYMI
jgi:SulP family sulfate permease